MRSVLLIALGLVIGVAGTFAYTRVDEVSTSLSAEPDQFGAYVEKAVPGASYTYAVTQVCVKGPGTVTLEDVQTGSDLHDVAVVGFAVTPPQAVGTRERQDINSYVTSIKSVYSEGVTKKVSTRCSDAMDVRDVAVEMKAPESLPAVVRSFTITYKVGDRERSITTGNTITFCSGTAADRQVADMADDVEDRPVAECPGYGSDN